MKMWLVALAVIFLWCGAARAQAPFYQGKTITIVVGTKAGDVYDFYPRMLALYMTKNIPGNLNIIIQNVVGAASLIESTVPDLSKRTPRVMPAGAS